jgi:hypothetical protein
LWQFEESLGWADHVFGVGAVECFAASVYESCAGLSGLELGVGACFFDYTDEFLTCKI